MCHNRTPQWDLTSSALGRHALHAIQARCTIRLDWVPGIPRNVAGPACRVHRVVLSFPTLCQARAIAISAPVRRYSSASEKTHSGGKTADNAVARCVARGILCSDGSTYAGASDTPQGRTASSLSTTPPGPRRNHAYACGCECSSTQVESHRPTKCPTGQKRQRTLPILRKDM